MGKIFNTKGMIIDEVVIVHTDGKTGKVTRHVCNRGFLHRVLRFLHLAHDSITAVGMADIAQWIGGLSSPNAFVDVGIGTGTTGDAVGDTQLQTSVLIRAVTPTAITVDQTNDTLQWAHVFSKANDASLTGFSSAVNEVGVFAGTVNGTSHMLLHIAGSTNYGAVDNCNWDNNDTLSITIKCQVKQGA
jgi:hypothetical protein